MKTLILPLVFAGGFLFCTAADSVRSTPASPVATWVGLTDPAAGPMREAGEAYINLIGRQMVHELQGAIASKGLPAAIGLVHLKEFSPFAPLPGQPRLTAARFTSLQLRNPANAPDAAEKAVLEKISTALQEGDDVPSLLLQKLSTPGQPDEWRAYRPLVALPLCLKCHGPMDGLPPEVRTAMAARYPQDQAQNYKAGTWRGLIRVSFIAPESPAQP